MRTTNLFYKGNKVQYKVVGQGEPLFLIHGYQADSRIWNSVSEIVSQKYMLIIPDLPGHGNSPLIQSINTMDFFADIINRICYSLGIENVSLAGHSMGGYAVLAFASKYNQNTDKIYLIDSHPFEDTMVHILTRNRETELLKQGKKHMIILPNMKNNFYDKNSENIIKQIDFATKNSLEQPVEGMIADLAGMMVRPDLTQHLYKARYSVKFIFGSNDNKIPIDKIKEITSSHIEVIEISNCGHLSILEKPSEIAEIIINS